MGFVKLQVFELVLIICALGWYLVIQGYAASLVEEGTPGLVSNANVFINLAPTPVPEPNGTVLQPPLIMPPLLSAPGPQTTQGPISSPPPSTPPPAPGTQTTQGPISSPPPSTPPPAPGTQTTQGPISSPPPSTPPAPGTQTTQGPISSPPPSTPPPAPGTQTTQGPVSSPPPSTPPPAPENHFTPPPTTIEIPVPAMPSIPSPAKPQPSDHPPVMPPAPITSPPNKHDVHSPASGSMPPSSPQTKAPGANSPAPQIAPVSNVPPRGIPETPRPSVSVLPEGPPSPPPDVLPPPPLHGNSPAVEPPLPEQPHSSPPEQNTPPTLAPPPSMIKEKPAAPSPPPSNKTSNTHPPVSQPPSKDPPASKHTGHSNSGPAPQPVSVSTPGFSSPKEHHNASDDKISPAPVSSSIPPASSKQAPRTKSDPKTSLRHNAPPPISTDTHYSPAPNPSPALPSGQTEIPSVSPKPSPSMASPHPKIPRLPPFIALPPPPPQKECAPMTCTEPLTYGPPEFPCVCVSPIQVGLRLTVAVYTFFPLVSKLAADIATGVFMKRSQVRIMGANAAGDNPDKTIVLIDLVPLKQKFDESTAYLIFQRFWQKQLPIETPLFGDYDVLYVRYPGLPPSPPLPPSTIGVIGSKPYPAHDNNGRTMQPLGVDIRGKQHKNGPKGSILAIIALSALVAIILTGTVVWILLFRHKDCLNPPQPTSATTVHSLAKSSGTAKSMVGDDPGSSYSLSSSMAAFTGSAKTFSSSDIEIATDFFNETRVLGEGGFGRVYGGVLEDGTKVAVKVLKRYDQQGGREFLAEVEMLSRLHHRNLVKLIGICIEDRTRCLVYELIPNGSVESHLHGIDKDASPLDWGARLKIALGAARALAYLHEDSSPRVIHRDFKASNILLEDDFTPKVSDFGLARTALDEKNKHISTRVMGTFGYVAPEYAMTGHLLVKSDVYSYGVVLLELLTGKKPVDMSQAPGQENLVSWARPLLTTTEGLESIIDQNLGPDFPFDSIAKVAAIASMCVQPEVSNRPFMGEVVQALKLISNECDNMLNSRSRSSTHEDLSLDMDDRSSTNSGPILLQSPMSNYDYRLDVERDLSMSELLSSSRKFDERDSESLRRYSSSGPIRTRKAKRVWKTMRRFSGGSVSEHGVVFKLWPGSH